jgi:MFS family permease
VAEADPGHRGRSARTSPFRALRGRNFRIFFAGQFVSIVGTWMQTVATSWLVYRLTGSALMLGLTAAAQQLPMLFVGPVAGVWSDRTDRRRVLLVAQSAAFVQAAVLAALTFAGAIVPWQIIAISLFLGLVNAVETPTRQAFLLELVGTRDELPNAIALQSMLFNSARFLGPTIAGLVLAAFGEAWCFLINAVSFLAIVLAYYRIRVPPRLPPETVMPWWYALVSGVRYALGFLAIRRLLMLLAALSFFAAPWQPLMPIFVRETFAGTSKTLGLMIGAVGAGALVGTVFLAMRPNAYGLGRVICVTSVSAGIALTLFSFVSSFHVALALLALFGFGLIVSVASSNTILQTVSDEDKRGRVISLYVTTFLGIAPLGSFAWGAAAEHIGAHATLTLCGIGITGAGVLFALGYPRWRESVREAYLRQRAASQTPTARTT